MCSVVSNVMMKKGYTVLFLNSCELNELFLKYHLADIALKGDIIYPVYQCDLLVIDDLGMENIYKNVTVPYLYSLIINRRQKHTIITTNLSHSQIAERYDFRISSRLMDKNLTINVPVLGEDLRLKKDSRVIFRQTKSCLAGSFLFDMLLVFHISEHFKLGFFNRSGIAVFDEEHKQGGDNHASGGISE